MRNAFLLTQQVLHKIKKTQNPHDRSAEKKYTNNAHMSNSLYSRFHFLTTILLRETLISTCTEHIFLCPFDSNILGMSDCEIDFFKGSWVIINYRSMSIFHISHHDVVIIEKLGQKLARNWKIWWFLFSACPQRMMGNSQFLINQHFLLDLFKIWLNKINKVLN